MKLKFKYDYIGRETAGKQYRKGDVADFPLEYALEILRLGGAEEIFEQAQDDNTPDVLPPAPKRKKVKHEDAQ